MSWSATITGHTEDKDEEARVIDELRECAQETGATIATVSTQHHGQVDLLATEGEPAAEGADAEPAADGSEG